METAFISLAIFAVVSAAVPVVANAVPGKLIPEAVLLLAIGAALGPYGFAVVEVGEPVRLLAELGMAFLFLLAGYEIEPANIVGHAGRRSALTWVVSFAAALGLVFAITGGEKAGTDVLSIAIALTTTAIGTLMPILAERGVLGTRVGDLVLSYGTYGELFPILAIALLLGARETWVTALVLLAFAVVAVFVAWRARGFRQRANKVFDFLVDRADSNSQTLVRVTVALLVGLVAVSAAFDLDIILGAFAAGFVLRYVVPEGNHSLEQKLQAIGYGFLIPLFFMVSGAGIDLAALTAAPMTLVYIILALVAVRFIPILVSLALSHETRVLPWFDRISVAFYCTTALPLIVAVTNIAVDAGALSNEFAGIMVAAGAVTVFLMPALAAVCQRVAAAHPVQAAHELSHANADGSEETRSRGRIVRDHLDAAHEAIRAERARRRAALASYRARRHERTHTPDEGE